MKKKGRLLDKCKRLVVNFKREKENTATSFKKYTFTVRSNISINIESTYAIQYVLICPSNSF